MSDQNWVTRFRKGLHPREAGRPAFGYSVEERDGLIIERDVAIPLRDGKKVYADIFLRGLRAVRQASAHRLGHHLQGFGNPGG
jgi:hypothetical protein